MTPVLQSDIREGLLQSFTALCRQDARILAAFVGGSIATGEADEFSDLDLYAIIQPQAYDRFMTEHREFFERLGEPVFLEHFDGFGFDMLVFIFDNGVQGELAIARPDHFLHIHGGPFKTLVDKQGLLDGRDFPWQGPLEEEQIEQLRRDLHWFWRDLSLFCVAMARDQVWTAYGYLESMRRRCINLVRLDKDFEAWSEGYEKLERIVEEEETALLKGSFSRLDQAEMARAVGNLVASYREVGARLAQRHALEYPSSLQDAVLAAASRTLRRFDGPFGQAS